VTFPDTEKSYARHQHCANDRMVGTRVLGPDLGPVHDQQHRKPANSYSIVVPNELIFRAAQNERANAGGRYAYSRDNDQVCV